MTSAMSRLSLPTNSGGTPAGTSRPNQRFVGGLGDPGLRECRHIRKFRQAGRTRNRKRLDLARDDEVLADARWREERLRVPPHHAGVRLGCALVGHMHHLDAFGADEMLGGDVGGASQSGRRVAHFARARADERDELLQRIDGQIVRDDEEYGRLRNRRDAFEILDGIERQVGVDGCSGSHDRWTPAPGCTRRRAPWRQRTVPAAPGRFSTMTV